MLVLPKAVDQRRCLTPHIHALLSHPARFIRSEHVAASVQLKFAFSYLLMRVVYVCMLRKQSQSYKQRQCIDLLACANHLCQQHQQHQDRRRTGGVTLGTAHSMHVNAQPDRAPAAVIVAQRPCTGSVTLMLPQCRNRGSCSGSMRAVLLQCPACRGAFELQQLHQV